MTQNEKHVSRELFCFCFFLNYINKEKCEQSQNERRQKIYIIKT